MKIAILGYGTVGSGVYDIITNGKTEELDKIEVKSVLQEVVIKCILLQMILMRLLMMKKFQ